MPGALSAVGRLSDGLCMGVQAQRLLLRSALQDPLNQRFVFLSETCAPLIPGRHHVRAAYVRAQVPHQRLPEA